MRKKIVVVMLLITFGFLLSSCELLDMFIKKYNVGFYSDEVLVKEETVKENELISPPTLNNKEGYDFLGWYKDLNDESTKWDFKNDKVNENLKLNALWELKINYLELTNLKLEEDMLIWDNIDEATYIVTINDNNLTLTVNEFPLNEYQEYLKEAKTIKVEPIKQDFTGIVSEITVKYNMTNVYEGYKLEFDEFDFPGFELSRSSYNTTTIDYEDHYFNVSEARLTSKDEEPKVGTVALILRTNGALELKEGYENESINKIFDLIISMTTEFDPIKFNENVAITLACKLSIKANYNISHEEMEQLLKDLVLTDNPYNCPHGRPTIIKFTIYELERMFKRVMN